MIDAFTINNIGTTKLPYGPSRCKNRLCANMRLYDGRFHQLVGILDASFSTHVESLQDIALLCDPDKTRVFAQDSVRMIKMLQSRTPFRSSNVELDPEINLQDYTNLY